MTRAARMLVVPAVFATIVAFAVSARSDATPPVVLTVTAIADAPDALPGNGLCAAEGGTCTLRAALEEAAAGDVPVEIDVPPGHYVLVAPLDVPRGVVTIQGTDTATTVLDAAGAVRVLDAHGGVQLTLRRLTIANGSATQEGGAIRAYDATLALDTVTVSTSAADGYGGGLFAAGASVSITGSTFEHDTAFTGGAIAAVGGDLTITGSTFTDCLATDAGGALATFGVGALAIADCTFGGNTAEHSGGAVWLAGARAPGTFAIVESTFDGNQSFGGSGGAIATDGLVGPAVDGVLGVEGCTFTGNQADRAGGAIASGVDLVPTDDTFAGNSAPESPDVATPHPFELCADAGICTGNAIDAFRCYQAKIAAGTAAFAPIVGVRLANAFGDLMVDMKAPQALCAPADTTGYGLLDATTHLEGYAITPEKGQPKLLPRTALAMTSELGALVVDAAKTDQLLVPTAVDPSTSQQLTTSQVDRFTCHKAKLAKGQPKLAKDLQLTVTDALTYEPTRVVVKKLARLCAPVGENGGATKHADHLLCFQVAATKGRCAAAAPANGGGGCKKEPDCGGVKGQTALCQPQAKFAAMGSMPVANAFDAETLDATKASVLCLPARRQP